MKNSLSKIYIILLLSFLIFAGCISTAKLSDFPQSSGQVDFEKYSKEFTVMKTPLYTSQTSNEYYFEKESKKSETEIVNSIKNALYHYQYQPYIFNTNDKCIFGKRGMVANEWNSITAVYYKIDIENQKVQIYISTKITQDITGGWRENRAMKVGKQIELNI